MDIIDTTWIQAKLDWLITLAPESDVQIIARILLWSVVAFIMVKIYKQATK